MNIEDIRGLFAKLALAYGKQFEDKWAGNDPDAMAEFWLQKLRRYEGREQVILNALDTITDRHTFPPSLPDFLAVCSEESMALARREAAWANLNRAPQIESKMTAEEREFSHSKTMKDIGDLVKKMRMRPMG